MERRSLRCGGILGGMQVTASTASDDAVGVWTLLKTIEALGYCTLAHYGQNTEARVGMCIKQSDITVNLFEGHAGLRSVKRGAQRVFPNARLAISGICIKLERPSADSIGWRCAPQEAIASCNTSTRTSSGIRMLPTPCGLCTDSFRRTTSDR